MYLLVCASGCVCVCEYVCMCMCVCVNLCVQLKVYVQVICIDQGYPSNCYSKYMLFHN